MMLKLKILLLGGLLVCSGFFIGLYSTINNNQIFKSVVYVKRLFIPRLSEPGTSYNEYGQLESKNGLTQATLDPSRKVKSLLILGNSHAGNHGGARFKGNAGTLNYYDGNFYEANDPLVGATGYFGGPWVEMANFYAKENPTTQIVLIPATKEGKTLSEWTIAGAAKDMLENKLHDLHKNNVPVTDIIWQGLARKNLTVTEYTNEMVKLIKFLRSQYPNANIHIGLGASCDRPDPEYIAAQKVAVKQTNVTLGPNINLAEFNFKYDGCHLSETGLRQIAIEWANAL